MWFDNLAESTNPGKNELSLFVKDVRNFLKNVLEDKTSFGFLWESSLELHQLAQETFKKDIAEGAGGIIKEFKHILSALI